MKFLSLEGPIRWLFIAHVCAGALALLLLAIPVFSKKGGKLHVTTGWIYTYGMTFVGLSAMVIAPWRAFFDPERKIESQGFEAFLFFIAFFTLSSLLFGLAPLKHKKRQAPLLSPLLIGVPVILAALGVMTLITGYRLNDKILIVFPVLAFTSVRAQLRYWLTTPKEKMHWWYAHMSGMGAAGIATLTAFIVIALPRLWPNPLARSVYVWVGPGVILGTLLHKWTMRCRLQFKDVE